MSKKRYIVELSAAERDHPKDLIIHGRKLVMAPA